MFVKMGLFKFWRKSVY